MDKVTNIFDTHAHYDDKRFDSDREELLSSLRRDGIVKILNAGCDMKSSRYNVELCARNDLFCCSVGVHPHDAKDYKPSDTEELSRLAKNKGVVAIGEIGLDYYYDYSPRDVQKRVFIEQLELCKELSLPVIIHSREATEDTIDILKGYNLRGVVHCFSGSAETAKIYLSMGYYIGFTGVITFPKATKPIEALSVVPLDKLLTETDCPYMAPVPYRGQRCDSGMLREIITLMASVKGITPQELADRTTANAMELFLINDER